jgi:hypothetical protein
LVYKDSATAEDEEPDTFLASLFAALWRSKVEESAKMAENASKSSE